MRSSAVPELHKAWQSDPTYDGSTEMARTMGIIENANLNHSMSSMFGGGITNDTAGTSTTRSSN